MKDKSGNISASQNKYTYVSGSMFDDITDGFYDYRNENGFQNIGRWIEEAARSKGK